MSGATGNGQEEKEGQGQEEGYEEWVCCFLLRMMWQRQVKILAKQNLIAICKAQKVSSFSAPPHRFPCALPSLSPLDKWQCLTRQQYTLSPLCNSLPYVNDTDTVPSYPLPTDEARVIAHATPTPLSALPPSLRFPSSICSPAQLAFLALFALSQWTWSHLTHSVCLLNLQQHWQHTEAAGTLRPRGAAASAATEAMLFVIKCEKYENSETKHAALHWLPQASHARTTHILIHIDPSARLPCPATPPRRMTHNLLPLERGLISVFPWLLPRQGSLITGCLWQLDSVYLYPVIARGAQANLCTKFNTSVCLEEYKNGGVCQPIYQLQGILQSVSDAYIIVILFAYLDDK